MRRATGAETPTFLPSEDDDHSKELERLVTGGLASYFEAGNDFERQFL